MSSRRRIRAGMSLLLALSVMWSAAALAAPTSGNAHRCNHRMAHSSQHQRHSFAPAEMQSPDAHQNSMPCCPKHTASAPAPCGGDRECCVTESETPRPEVMLLSSEHSYSKQLHAAHPAGSGTLPQSRVLLLSRSAVAAPPGSSTIDLISPLRI